jgi:hypothetical protein
MPKEKHWSVYLQLVPSIVKIPPLRYIASVNGVTSNQKLDQKLQTKNVKFNRLTKFEEQIIPITTIWYLPILEPPQSVGRGEEDVETTDRRSWRRRQWWQWRASSNTPWGVASRCRGGEQVMVSLMAPREGGEKKCWRRRDKGVEKRRRSAEAEIVSSVEIGLMLHSNRNLRYTYYFNKSLPLFVPLLDLFHEWW